MESNMKLWRYMSLSKLLMIFEEKALYFPNADSFEDKFEGSYPVKVMEDIKKNIKQALGDEDPGKGYENLKKLIVSIKRNTYISCWNKSEHESDAMWKIYSENSKETVAIQTSYEKIMESIEKPYKNKITGEYVKYIDYPQENNMTDYLYSQFLYKRKSFSHENEFRFIYKDPKIEIDKNGVGKLNFESFEIGKNINVNLNTLIESIYISPLAPDWFHSLINKIVKRHSLEIEIKKSTLHDNPFD